MALYAWSFSYIFIQRDTSRDYTIQSRGWLCDILTNLVVDTLDFEHRAIVEDASIVTGFNEHTTSGL